MSRFWIFVAILLAPATVHADPVVSATVDCAVFHVDVAGDGLVIIGVGSQPPYGMNGASTDIAIGAYERSHAFLATVEVDGVRYFEQYVDCTPPVPELVPAPVARRVFTGVELAPPW